MRISDWSSDVCSSDLVSVEDPLAEDDPEGMTKFTAAAGNRVQIVGDDFLVTDAARVRKAAAAGACNALLVTPNQARSEERRVGKEGVRTCHSRWATQH